ncbi:MAG: glycosyltransferase [Solirubrobacterales bacterium]|nr:glycosyltransferase [Solirubrobacterales bacterium]
MRRCVALLSLGTTPGLRVADAQLAQLIEAAGVSCRVVSVPIGAVGRLRRHPAATDLIEALAARRAASSRAVRDADAIIFSATTAGYFARPSVPYAIRFDSPAALNRPGPAGAWQRIAERRSLSSASLLLPWGAAGERAVTPIAAGVSCIVVPFAVEPLARSPLGASTESPEESLSVAYAGYPDKRGLDLLCTAWARVRRPGAKLVVAGISRERALEFLASRQIAEPEGVQWVGMLAREQWLELLGRATLMVNASRREDYGLAPLEALAAGAALVTLPAVAAYEALGIARELAPALVGASIDSESLTTAWRAGLGLDASARLRYAKDAAKLLAPYARAAVAAVVAEEVLPALLNQGGARSPTATKPTL